MFFAGAKPLESGEDYLWIVDYKTATHGREGVENFSLEERSKYEAQMEAYARMMRDRVGQRQIARGVVLSDAGAAGVVGA